MFSGFGIPGADTCLFPARTDYRVGVRNRYGWHTPARYLAGKDAQALYARRTEIGPGAARKEAGNLFLGK